LSSAKAVTQKALEASPANAVATVRTILGIDPGLRKTGFGLVRIERGQATYVASGTISTLSAGKDLAPRLGMIFAGVSELVQQYRPDEAAIEKVFVNVNPQSTLLLGQARGAAMVALNQGGLIVYEYTALQPKSRLWYKGCWHSRANPRQMLLMPWLAPSVTGIPRAAVV
jgi:crossover junction endodeoxyribonuclease RuvC